MHTHSPTEWAQMLSLAVGGFGAYSIGWHLFVEADLADFDPRPAARRAHQGLVYAGHDLNRAAASAVHAVRPVAVYALAASRTALRDAALTLAALLILTIPTGESR